MLFYSTSFPMKYTGYIPYSYILWNRLFITRYPIHSSSDISYTTRHLISEYTFTAIVIPSSDGFARKNSSSCNYSSLCTWKFGNCCLGGWKHCHIRFKFKFKFKNIYLTTKLPIEKIHIKLCKEDILSKQALMRKTVNHDKIKIHRAR